MAGEKTRAHDFSSYTSSVDDLDGVVDNSRRTSSVVTGWNDDSDGPRYGLSVKTCRAVDCSAAAVLLRMRSTASVANPLNVETIVHAFSIAVYSLVIVVQ